MNRDEIISMAFEAFKSHPDFDGSEPLEGEELKGMERFAALVAERAIAEALISVSYEVAKEREECAMLFETQPRNTEIYVNDIVEAIRARGNPA